MYHPDLLRHPESCPALVLNADYTPLSYYPLSLWPWQTAVKAVFLERVDIVANYAREVHSPSKTMQIPSVIALRQYVKPSEYPAFRRGHCDVGRPSVVMPSSICGQPAGESSCNCCRP